MHRAVPRRALSGHLQGARCQNLLLPAAREDNAVLRAAALRVPVSPHAQLRPARLPSAVLRQRLSAVQRGASCSSLLHDDPPAPSFAAVDTTLDLGPRALLSRQSLKQGLSRTFRAVWVFALAQMHAPPMAGMRADAAVRQPPLPSHVP